MRMTIDDSPQAALGFLLSQITHIESEVYEIKYPEITYTDAVPIDTSANEWAKSITFFTTDKAGAATWINANGTDIPFAEVTRDKHEAPVEMAGIGYRYNLEEINQARMLGINLSADKASAARFAYETLMDDVAYVGDAKKGFEGLYNGAGVTAVSAPNGAASSPLWANKTADEILTDINGAITGVWTGTTGVEMADTIHLPLAQFAALTTKRIGPDTSMTVMEFIRKNNVFTAMTGRELTFRANYRLSTLGAGGTARMVAYRKDPRAVKMHIPMALKFLAPQQKIFDFVVPGMFRTGGVEWRLPKSGRYIDGI